VSPFAFTRNLGLWDRGAEVTALQQFLISQASGPAAEQLKAHGVTTVFGFLTYNALVEFQKKAGIVPASGYFGPKTRAYINKLTQ
jgi:peptidoglycan hydrolase-like protein with peptidoglycan-binding domain